MTALNERWHQPTRTGTSGNCVEARIVDGVVEVRNSNQPDAGTVRFTRAEWETFLAAVTVDGEFRLP
jgi:Domain of unknown function (DUF397)